MKGKIEDVVLEFVGGEEFSSVEPSSGEGDLASDLRKKHIQMEDIAKELNCEPTEITSIYNFLRDKSDFEGKRELDLLKKATKICYKKNVKQEELHLIELLVSEGLESLSKDGVSLIKIAGTLEIDGGDSVVFDEGEFDAVRKLLRDRKSFGIDRARITNDASDTGQYFGSPPQITNNSITISTDLPDEIKDATENYSLEGAFTHYD